jgi:hypothetical protein
LMVKLIVAKGRNPSLMHSLRIGFKETKRATEGTLLRNQNEIEDPLVWC